MFSHAFGEITSTPRPSACKPTRPRGQTRVSSAWTPCQGRVRRCASRAHRVAQRAAMHIHAVESNGQMLFSLQGERHLRRGAAVPARGQPMHHGHRLPRGLHGCGLGLVGRFRCQQQTEEHQIVPAGSGCFLQRPRRHGKPLGGAKIALLQGFTNFRLKNPCGNKPSPPMPPLDLCDHWRTRLGTEQLNATALCGEMVCQGQRDHVGCGQAAQTSAVGASHVGQKARALFQGVRHTRTNPIIAARLTKESFKRAAHRFF